MTNFAENPFAGDAVNKKSLEELQKSIDTTLAAAREQDAKGGKGGSFDTDKVNEASEQIWKDKLEKTAKEMKEQQVLKESGKLADAQREFMERKVEIQDEEDEVAIKKAA